MGGLPSAGCLGRVGAGDTGGTYVHDSPSASGPRARAGRKVRPATISTAPTNSPEHKRFCVWSVPALAGTGLCSASDPAKASTKTIGRNRPSSIARPIVVLNHCVSAPSPAKALPLLLAPEV